ncbi:MAG: MaoC family dehydratase [Rubrivivax sp.]|jgi:2-methylfumaryl-CoA hydratase|nr:MaoC family dehydratase [Rubrivivax sp.]
MTTKTRAGNFFEDFRLGQRLVHAPPRTVTQGDVAVYTALFGPRFALHSSDPFARALGLPGAPIDSMLAFHLVFGRTVADVSLNAIANLGYAGCRFGVPVYPGDTITADSRVIGLKPNKDGKTGVVYVHSTGVNQRGETVLDYRRWVMVRKRDESAPPPETVVPELPASVPVAELHCPIAVAPGAYDAARAGSDFLWDDYVPGERIDHVDGMTIEDAEHMLAARLYQNNAKVHFNQHVEREGRFGKRIVYGGHVISLARALSCNGLANAQLVAAIHGGRHAAPSFAGDTIYAWSEVLAKDALPGRHDVGALRLRTVATKDRACHDFPGHDAAAPEPAVVLDLDYTVLMPRRL